MTHRSNPVPAAALACLLLLAATSGCSSSEPAVDSSGSLVSEEGRIAFMRATGFDGPDIESDVFTVKADGSDERRLTNTPGLDGFPSWSPDGERIAFASDRDGGNWELYTMNADGSEQRRLTNTPDHDESVTAWSPDGRKIAYVTDVIENPVIRVMNADGSDRRRLTAGNWPSWSPDGERIVYTAFSGVTSLAVMNADGSGQRNLAPLIRRLTGTAYAEEPAWSPDGEKIAFVSTPFMGDEEIYVVNPDGTGRRRLTDIPGADHWPPAWSPEGDRIAFTSDGTKGVGEIYLMNADGSGLTRLTRDPADDAFPAWRP